MWQTGPSQAECSERNIIGLSNWKDQECLETWGSWSFNAHLVVDLEKAGADPKAAPLSKLRGWDPDPLSTLFAPLFQVLELELPQEAPRS